MLSLTLLKTEATSSLSKQIQAVAEISLNEMDSQTSFGTYVTYYFHTDKIMLAKSEHGYEHGYLKLQTYIAFLMSIVPSDFAPSISVSWYVRIVSFSTNHRRFQLRLKGN